MTSTLKAQQKKIVLLTAGGTGGHFFPAIALLEELQLKENIEVHLATDKRCKKYLTQTAKVNAHIIDLYINSSGVNKLLFKLKLPFLILNALIKAVYLVLRLKPSVIIGFGGYPSMPVVLTGQLFRIQTVIYEQNSFFGKTNKIFAKRAKFIALAYQNTKNFPDIYFGKSNVVGDLIRDDIKNLPKKSNFDKQPFNLLVIGGSQGAQFFTTLVPEAIRILVTKYPKIKIIVKQQVQKPHHDLVKKIYNEIGVQSVITDFFHDIYRYYETSHLVIGRSGATTIAELTQIGLPAIFIPLPSAAEDHQYYNAQSLQNSNASWVFRQSEISPLILAEHLHKLIKDPSLIKAASVNLLKRKKDGTKHLADTVLKIIT